MEVPIKCRMFQVDWKGFYSFNKVRIYKLGRVGKRAGESCTMDRVEGSTGKRTEYKVQ